MRVFCFACLLGMSALSSLPALAGGIDAAKRPVAYEVIKSEFGLFNQTSDGKGEFIPTREVPLVANQGYGWVVALRTDKTTLRWREEFQLPVRPDSWGPPDTVGQRRISVDGRTAITEHRVTPRNGMIFNTWAVAPGDPPGRYRIRVYVENRLVESFDFQVKVPVQETTPSAAPKPAPAGS